MATSCLGGVGNWVGALIISQFNYLYCFSDNITNLRNEANQLEGTTHDLQLRVDGAKNDSRVIYREVDTWLQDSKNVKDEMDGILNEVPNVESGCLKLGARFFLSRRAKKTTDRVKGLIILGQSKLYADVIAHPAPAAAAAAEKEIPTTKSYEFQSRKKIEEDIMATLRGGDVNMIGICGMGGLGKTTMAKRIRNRALEEHVFDKVVMVVVSRPINKVKIQDEIGGSLGLKLQGECSEARVQKLHARLSGTEDLGIPSRILLVLDDVWEELVLEDLGIPSSYKGCTILLTSRNHDVLNAMHVQIFGMKVLSEEDSWLLFRTRAGKCVDDTKFNSIAKEVVRECAGLPIVLITVGAALKGEVDESIWGNALQRLKINCTPDNIPEYIKQVYNPLKLSYDALEHIPNSQEVFLLCCVYPEDAHIPLEQLTYFCMGLRLLEGAIGNVEEVRNRIRALTKVLKNRSLLLDSKEGDGYVRMHDVVRDVCIFIAKQKGYIGDNDLTSSLQRYKLRSGFELLRRRNSDEEINFDGITDLYVLSIESCSQLTSLPFTQVLRNLNTLVLSKCPRVDTLSVVGELVNLEILICHGCDSIEELPPEICDDRISSNSFQNLKILKLDDLPVLKQLWKSSQNDLGKDFLPQLEVLYIENCGMMETVFLWKGEDGNENTRKIFPKLKELRLDDLPNLISLCQGIEGIEFPLMRKIKISGCGKMKGMVWNENISGGSNNNASIHALFCPQQVSFSELAGLIIFGCQSILSLFTSSMAGNLVNLKELRILGCAEMVQVIKDDEEKGMSGGRQTAVLFPKLQELELSRLPKLVSFCESKGIESIQFPVLRIMEIRECGKMKGMVANGVTSNENNSGGDSSNSSDTIHLFCESQQVSFSEMEELKISGCRGILSLFTSSMAGNLVNLKELRIIRCDEMVEVIKDDEEKGMSGGRQTALLFPKLQKLKLWCLPKLVSFCESKGIESIQFPVLRSMKISGCGKMKGMVANGVTSNENNSGGSSSNAADIIHLFCQSKQVSFGCVKELETDWNPFCSHTIHVSLFNGLEELTIWRCAGSLSLFSSSITGNLVNLTRLDIQSCDKMVKVIEEKEEEKEIVVSGAQRTTILFPKLHMIELRYLPELVRFCEWKCDVELPSLTELRIYYCNNMKSFTLGPLHAPKLESVYINYQDVGGVKALNGFLKQRYLSREERMKTTDVATQKEAPAAAAK